MKTTALGLIWRPVLQKFSLKLGLWGLGVGVEFEFGAERPRACH